MMLAGLAALPSASLSPVRPASKFPYRGLVEGLVLPPELLPPEPEPPELEPPELLPPPLLLDDEPPPELEQPLPGLLLDGLLVLGCDCAGMGLLLFGVLVVVEL